MSPYLEDECRTEIEALADSIMKPARANLARLSQRKVRAQQAALDATVHLYKLKLSREKRRAVYEVVLQRLLAD